MEKEIHPLPTPNRQSLSELLTNAGGPAAVWLVALLIYGIPIVLPNESAYLVAPRRLLDPAFLTTDWEMQVRASGGLVSALFDYLSAPLWMISSNPIVVALTARVILISAVTWGLFYLIRALGIARLPAAAGLCLWILYGQSIAAGEWMVGGAEKKVIAYVLVLSSLALCIRRKYLIAGLLAGLAVVAHILVGAWFCVAATLSILVATRRPMPECLRFALPAMLVALPVAIAALVFANAAEYAALQNYLGKTVAELVVVKRNSHHGDPFVFLSFRNSVVAVAFFVSALFACSRLSDPYTRRLLMAFVSVLALFWVSGLAARATGQYGYLYLMPFRLGDAMVPMLVAVLGYHALRNAFAATRWRQPNKSVYVAGIGIVCLLFVSVLLLKKAGPRVIRNSQKTYALWQDLGQQHKEPYKLMAAWIKDNTATTSDFLIPPSADWFKLFAERSAYVSFKGAPGNQAINKWFDRLQVLNLDQPIMTTGYAMHDEVSENYAALSSQRLSTIARDDCVSYYLVETARSDLSQQLIFSAPPFYLYDIRQADAPDACEADANPDS